MFFGWWVVGTTFLIALWGWGLGFYGPAIFLVELQQQNHWTATTVSFAISGYYILGAVLITGLGDAMRRWGGLRTVLCGFAAMGTGVYALTWVSQPWQMYAAFAAMAVGWCTMSSASINILLAPWFDRRRGMAVSLAITGATCGGMIIAPLLLGLTGTFGFHSGIGIAVALMVVTLVPVSLLTLRHTPASLGVYPDGEGSYFAAALAPTLDPAATRGVGGDALRTVRYWTISGAFALGLAAQVGLLTHFIAFLAPLHGKSTAAIALSVTTLSAIIARFLVGAIIDRSNRRVVAAGVFGIQACGLAFLLIGDSAVALYSGCVLFGFGVGNLVSLVGLLVQKEFRAEQFATVVSLMVATNQITYAFSPSVLGLLRDWTGNYQASLELCIAFEIIAAGTILIGSRSKAVLTGASSVASYVPPTSNSPAGDFMLQLRPNCECCDRDLPPDAQDAVNCSFECTFCRTCAETVLGGKCPNCAGELVRRPVRPPAALAKHPASTQRVVKQAPCVKVA